MTSAFGNGAKQMRVQRQRQRQRRRLREGRDTIKTVNLCLVRCCLCARTAHTYTDPHTYSYIHTHVFIYAMIKVQQTATLAATATATARRFSDVTGKTQSDSFPLRRPFCAMNCFATLCIHMYVCVYVCVCVCLYIYMYVCVCVEPRLGTDKHEIGLQGKHTKAWTRLWGNGRQVRDVADWVTQGLRLHSINCKLTTVRAGVTESGARGKQRS